MPKSFLIKKPRANSTTGSMRKTSWDKKVNCPSDVNSGTLSHDVVQPCSALIDSKEMIEPLDLVVTRVEDVKAEKTGGNCEEDASVFVDTKSTAPDDNSGKETSGLLTVSLSAPPSCGPGPKFPFPVSPTSCYAWCRHRSFDGDSGLLPPPPAGPAGVGYFSRCLMAYKFQGHVCRGLVKGKRHRCVFCPKSFNDKFDLKRHIRTHTGVRPFKCDRCFRAFTQRCSLEVHQRKVHNMELNFAFKQRRGKVYVCEDCGHSTHDINEHYVHTVREHRGPSVTEPYSRLLRAPARRGAGMVPIIPPAQYRGFAGQQVTAFPGSGSTQEQGGTSRLSGMYF